MSVGALSLGGSGKTPIARHVAAWLTEYLPRISATFARSFSEVDPRLNSAVAAAFDIARSLPQAADAGPVLGDEVADAVAQLALLMPDIEYYFGLPIRDAIVDNARSWSRLRNSNALKESGGLRGDGLKRPPRGYDPEHRHIEDLKRKSFYAMVDAPAEDALEPDFIDRVEDAFRLAAPLNRFITHALGLPF